MLEPIMQNEFLLLGASPRKTCLVSHAWVNGANCSTLARSLELKNPVHSLYGLGSDACSQMGSKLSWCAIRDMNRNCLVWLQGKYAVKKFEMEWYSRVADIGQHTSKMVNICDSFQHTIAHHGAKSRANCRYSCKCGTWVDTWALEMFCSRHLYALWTTKSCTLDSSGQHHYACLSWTSLWEALCTFDRECFLDFINSPEAKLRLGKSN